MIDAGRVELIHEAAKDLRYLLNRGYRKPTALKLVGDRYGLNRRERLILFRGILPKHEAEAIKSKRLGEWEVRGEEIWLDGFNVLHTVEAMLRNDLLIMGDDGVLRDVSGIHGKYRPTKTSEEALTTIIEALKGLGVSKPVILYEGQVSKSGEVAALTRRILREMGLEGEARTTKTVDSELIKSGEIVATSDSIILLRCRRFFDIPGYLASKKGARILKL